MTDAPNVVLLVWDAARAQSTSLHGYERETTPFLASFARSEAVHYAEARAPATWTLPSFASMVTGRYPREHGTTAKHTRFTLPERHLATRLRERGYHTALYTNNTYLRAEEFGFSPAFDAVESDSFVRRGDAIAVDPELHAKVHGSGAFGRFVRNALRSGATIRSLVAGAVHKLETSSPCLARAVPASLADYRWRTDDGAGAYVRSFLDSLDDTGDRPFFACFDFLEAHAPYRPPPGFADYAGEAAYRDVVQTPPWRFLEDDEAREDLSVLRDLYDGCLRYLDGTTAEVVAGLRDRDLLDETLVVVAGDHGEGFGEPGECRPRCVGHLGGVEEAVTHVPLVVRYPGGAHGGTRVDDPVSLKDLYGTVLEVCGGGDETDDDPADPTLRPDAERPAWILSECDGITRASAEGMRAYGADPAPVDRHLVAYYEADDDVVKYRFAEDDGEPCDDVVRLAGDRERLAGDAAESVVRRAEAALADLRLVGERGEEGDPALSERTLDQLEHLGYR